MSERMTTFDELVVSRRSWLQEVLIPWCRVASRKDLLRAEQEWTDLAGKIAPERSLWLWAWSRFPPLYVEGLGGLEETWPVRVTPQEGMPVVGYPDSRQSERGRLTIVLDDGRSESFLIDAIQTVERVSA